MNEAGLSLNEYSGAVEAGWSHQELMRAILHDLPRRFHALTSTEQGAVLQHAPPLARTRWDALLAASVEHVARLHGHALPPWVDEPERFLDETWVVTDIHCIRMDALAFAPAAFTRHGALPDPRDLDYRGGEHRAWLP